MKVCFYLFIFGAVRTKWEKLYLLARKELQMHFNTSSIITISFSNMRQWMTIDYRGIQLPCSFLDLVSNLLAKELKERSHFPPCFLSSLLLYSSFLSTPQESPFMSTDCCVSEDLLFTDTFISSSQCIWLYREHQHVLKVKRGCFL